MTEWSDEELLVQARQQPDAFEELYRRHVDKIIRFAARRSGDPQSVADLVAHVWLEAIGSLDRFDPAKGKAVPWLLGIAAHVCASERHRRLQEHRTASRLAGRRMLDEDDFARLEREIDAAAIAPSVRSALAQLPPSERTVAELVIVEDIAPADAAAALGITPAAARMRLARARRKLRKAVREGSHDADRDPVPVPIEEVTT